MNIAINDRQHGDGDLITSKYECHLPPTRPDHPWEHPYCMTGKGAFWGYTQPLECLPSNTIPSKLVRARAWGGNTLVNFGPQPDGDMPQEFYQCMREVKDWMSWAAPALTGTTAEPRPDPCTLPVTVKDNIWYVHLLPQTIDAPASGNTITLNVHRKVRRISWLKTGEELDGATTHKGLVIHVPEKLRTDAVDIVKIEWLP